MIQYVEGDLLESDCDVIVHGCNCFNTMNSGIAKSIRDKFPEAWKVDQKTVYGDINKLGSFTMAECENNGKKILVLNCYTQYKYGTSHRHTDYDAIRKCMRKINSMFDKNVKIGFPKIGTGLAGGDWNIIEKIINEEFGDYRIVYVYVLPEVK